ncbi:phage portal protein [Mycobacterium angelicum]|uniref:Phage portal protein n=1 Tax=Mycobacterium angelicum TaxID=470074 RepID=A0A1X0A1I4_MYCAN|nr:phage portal protein [Mycobacterium angelicum]MCV7195403.1 phage portal protein [Mycobacterium angelicum]ORA23832.1 hypothetical protein BST12_06660 [Mycobacterium angelicum]
MTSDNLVELIQTLDAPQHRYCELERYYTGTQQLAFLAPEQRTALGDRLGRMCSNIPRLAVTSLAERLRITGFTGDDQIWSDWLRNDLEIASAAAHREALLFGASYVIVWSDKADNPSATVESAKQVAVITDPATREVTSAVKRWRTKTETHAMAYFPDRIEHWRAKTPGAATAGFDLIEEIPNPLGVVPVVPIVNSDRILGCGASEIDDLAPLCDALNKILADMLVSSEFTGMPRRYATGLIPIEKPLLDSDGLPVLDGNGNPQVELANPLTDDVTRAWIAEDPAAKFGSLPAGDLAGYESAVRILLTQIQAVSALPGSMLGVLADQPTSAEALLAGESGLTSKAEARQQIFGKSWSQVGRLMVAVRNRVQPSNVPEIQVVWCNPGTASTAAEADAAVKYFTSGLLSRRTTLARLGFSADQIEAELAQLEQDAAISADIKFGRYISGLSDR